MLNVDSHGIMRVLDKVSHEVLFSIFSFPGFYNTDVTLLQLL